MNVGAFVGEREVALIADELSNAVELTLNPTVAHDARKQAYTACERWAHQQPYFLLFVIIVKRLEDSYGLPFDAEYVRLM